MKKYLILTILLFISSMHLFASMADSLIMKQPWFTIRFPDGSAIEGLASPEERWEQYGLPNDLTGKTFYDVGCYNGAQCFLAAQKGASEIFGLDAFVWEMNPNIFHDFKVASSLIAPNVQYALVETEPCPSYFPTYEKLSNKQSIEQFANTNGEADIVLAAGIVYHLLDPVKFLKDLKMLVKKDTGKVFITTWCSKHSDKVAHFLPGWRGDPTNFWVLSTSCMQSLLEHLGYKVENIRSAVNPSDKQTLMSFECIVPTEK